RMKRFARRTNYRGTCVTKSIVSRNFLMQVDAGNSVRRLGARRYDSSLDREFGIGLRMPGVGGLFKTLLLNRIMSYN
ncbi:hypothetical protein V1478_008036, partial [Vespula squamosa]